MTTQNLSRVTQQTIENYRAAAHQGIVAYRLGGHRLVRVVNGALEERVHPRTASIAPRAAERMKQVRGRVSTFIENGIDQIARSTEKVVELSSSTATAQVGKLARFAGGIENEVVANGLNTAAQLTLPGAKVALALSSKLAEGANKLADAAGARPVRKAARTTAAGAKRRAAPAARKAKAAAKTAAKRVTQVAKAVKAPAAKAPRAARRAKEVTETVAA